MRDASGEQSQAFEFLPGERFFLAPPKVGNVNTGPNKAVNAARRIAEWDQICVEKSSSGGEIELALIINRLTGGQRPPIRAYELLSEVGSKDLFDELSSDLLIGKADCLLLGPIESHKFEPVVRRDINHEQACRDSIKHLLVLEIIQRQGASFRPSLNSHA